MRRQISIYVNSEGISPSGYYRILQFFKDKREIIIVHSLLPPKLYKWRHKQGDLFRIILVPYIFFLICIRTGFYLICDLFSIRNGVVIISRNVVPRYLPYLHCLLLNLLSRKNRVIWDFDDNIIDGLFVNRREWRLLSKISYKIVVINEFLKSQIDSCYQDKVCLIPTTDGDMCNMDVDSIINSRLASLSEEFVLIWVATSVNIQYLERIVFELDECAKRLKINKNVKLVLKVVCNKPLLTKTYNLRIENVEWTREIAISELSKAHCGIMPLIENKFTLGKGGFKLIQYLSIGLPVIASAVGFNNSIVTEDCGYLIDDDKDTTGWSKAVLSLSEDKNKYLLTSKAAFMRYQTEYSFYKYRDIWYQWCGIE